MAIVDEIEPFSATVERDGEVVTVVIAGEVDLSVSPQLSEVIAEVAESAPQVRLDFERCTFVDSSGIQVVVGAARRCRDNGGELSVVNDRGDVARVFEISGLFVDGSPVRRGHP